MMSARQADQDTAPVRLGLVGLGDWGEHVAQAVAAEPGVTLAGCYARSGTTRAAFAARYGCRPYDHYEAMLADNAIEGIVIMTPNLAHREQVEAAARCGKHCLVTKPIAASLADARAMIAACQDAGVILCIGHQSRREPALRTLKTLLAAGHLGRPVMVEANITTGRGTGISPDQWRWAREECPGGVLIQLGIHHIDTLQHLLGPVARVQAWQRRAHVQAQIDDVTGTMLEFESGVLGYLGSCYSASQACWIKLYAERHVAHYDQHLGLELSDDTWAGGPVRKAVAPGMALRWPIATMCEEVVEFGTCIRTGKAPEIDGAQGLRNLAVVLAAVRANETGRAVTVDEIMR